MNTTRYQEWFTHRIRIADDIVARFGEDGIPDGEILLCCAASALAAEMWPGERIDRARFIQFLVEFSPPDAGLLRISVPVLDERLRDERNFNAALVLERRFYPRAGLRPLSSEDVDQQEGTILEVVPNIPLSLVRSSAYAAIMYADLRSGLVHEYGLSPYLSSIPGIKDSPQPSYMNWLVDPELQKIDQLAAHLGMSRDAVRKSVVRQMRLLHLPYAYVKRSLSATADAAFRYWATLPTWERPRPAPWWIEGGPAGLHPMPPNNSLEPTRTAGENAN